MDHDTRLLRVRESTIINNNKTRWILRRLKNAQYICQTAEWVSTTEYVPTQKPSRNSRCATLAMPSNLVPIAPFPQSHSHPPNLPITRRPDRPSNNLSRINRHQTRRTHRREPPPETQPKHKRQIKVPAQER